MTLRAFVGPVCGLLCAFGAVALLTASVSASGANDKRIKKLREAIEEFQTRDQRLQDVGWRLVRGNAAFCENRIPSVGLQLQDTASYGRPDLVSTALGLTTAFAVQTAARGSPAGEAGTFTRNRGVARMGNVDPNTWEAARAGSWQRLTRAHNWIDEALKKPGAVTFVFADGSQSALTPVPVCATRFELASHSTRALSEGKRVVIGERFPAFEWEEEDEFAGVVAHELAHNLLGHRAWLDREGRKRRAIRLTEREADRLMPWLMANAGYDPEAAYRFMVRWGKKYDRGLFRKRTHDGWDERAEFIAAELPLIAELMEREGKADWSVHFRREIEADPGASASKDLAQRD
ncbi:MAG: hypothetical protein AAFQ34_10355 [Pseudomonadota bacterium]